ncbi:MAG: aldo/keto reductase [Hellea sp.]|nr:aldo/keto reductase [Hellea sp.]
MFDRRTVLGGIAGTAILPGIMAEALEPLPSPFSLKSGKPVPPIGMGTWITFSVDPGGPEMPQRRKVLEAFYKAGGGMIDSSPMYGRSEDVIGKLRSEKLEQSQLFSATKIWTPAAHHGETQLSDSHRLWQEPVLDLVHVHNLLEWETHLKMLRTARDAGKVRYIGLTTSHGRRHDKMEELIKTEPIDAVQFSYNIQNRAAENRLLPASAAKGLAVIINRPFMTSRLFDLVAGYDVPAWAAEELGTQSWAEYFLKFVISHPAVTCAIPATRNPAHMAENMRAGTGQLPDRRQRLKMIASFEAL